VFNAHMYGLFILSSKLLHYLLQEIWNEVGESDEERDKMLLQLEQDCLDVYKKKVELAAKSRAQLLQALSDAKLELSTLLSALGEKSFVGIVSNYLIYPYIG
jgi:protein regulator of cytokinesis 1